MLRFVKKKPLNPGIHKTQLGLQVYNYVIMLRAEMLYFFTAQLNLFIFKENSLKYY